MKITLVAALDRTSAIGRDAAMPWHLPDDLKRFKALTLGKPVLMGRRTAQAIGRALPGRENLVMSRGSDAPYPGQRIVHSLADAIEAANGEDLAVIGGGEIYAMALPMATHMALTLVDTTTADADAFFPAFDPADWQQTWAESHAADARHAFAFRFVDYKRRGD